MIWCSFLKHISLAFRPLRDLLMIENASECYWKCYVLKYKISNMQRLTTRDV